MKTMEPKGRLSFVNYKSDSGGVGYIRTIIPSVVLGSWRYKLMQLEPTVLSNFVPDPNFYKSQAFVKFQRSATAEQLNIFKYFASQIRKQTSTPIIYDIDDLLFDIPKSNFASEYYQQNKEYVEQMLEMVDGMTVSTNFLKKKYSKYNKNISVVRNRLAKCLWGNIKEYTPSTTDKLKIVYPGSQNHFSIKGRTGEGGDFGEELLSFIKDTKKRFEWIFIGGIPEELKNDNDIVYHEWIDYMSYPMVLKNINADIGIAPLEHNDFNRSKSNLKMLEYAVCGIPGVYTDIEPYKTATAKGKSETDLINLIENMSQDVDFRLNSCKKDQNQLKDNIFLEDCRLKWLNEHLALFNQKIK